MGADRSHGFLFWTKTGLYESTFSHEFPNWIWTGRFTKIKRPVQIWKCSRPDSARAGLKKCLKFRSGWLAVFFRTGPAPGLARFKINPIGFVLEPFVFLWGRWIWQIPVLILLPPSWWTLPYIIYYNASHFPWHWGLVRTLWELVQKKGEVYCIILCFVFP